jgi:hypothetical protein
MLAEDVADRALQPSWEEQDDDPDRFQREKLRNDFARFRTSQLAQKTKPIQSEYQPGPVDGLTSLLSKTHIDLDSPARIYHQPTITAPQLLHSIDVVIRNVLSQDLKTAESNEKLLPDHPCFHLARQYALKYGISDKAVDSHIKLACGYLKFPILMLLNPYPYHEVLSFDEMVRRCRTLGWLQEILQEINLKLGDIMILDVCTLLGDLRIKNLDEKERNKAMSDAYDVTWQMLEMTKPNIIISCQCKTMDFFWGGGMHVAAQRLCSSIRDAGKVKKTDINGHAINVIQAYHPGGFLNHDHPDPGGIRLKKLLHQVYLPCAVWKNEPTGALLASFDDLIDATIKHLAALKHARLRIAQSLAKTCV